MGREGGAESASRPARGFSAKWAQGPCRGGLPPHRALGMRSYLAVQVGVMPVPVPVPWKPNSVDWPAATEPL